MEKGLNKEKNQSATSQDDTDSNKALGERENLTSRYKNIFQQNNVIIFLPINLSICFWCSKEQSHGDCPFEYPQHMFRLRNKKII